MNKCKKKKNPATRALPDKYFHAHDYPIFRSVFFFAPPYAQSPCVRHAMQTIINAHILYNNDYESLKTSSVFLLTSLKNNNNKKTRAGPTCTPRRTLFFSSKKKKIINKTYIKYNIQIHCQSVYARARAAILLDRLRTKTRPPHGSWFTTVV